MVLPLVDEANPKCYVCHEGFDNIDDLRAHQQEKHKELSDQKPKNEPAPGDVTVF